MTVKGIKRKLLKGAFRWSLYFHFCMVSGRVALERAEVGFSLSHSYILYVVVKLGELTGNVVVLHFVFRYQLCLLLRVRVLSNHYREDEQDI